MSDNPDWDDLAEKIKAVTERMMRAGWIKETLHTSQGLGIEYTPEGMQKMKQLLKLMAEIDITTMSPDDMESFRALVRQFGSNLGRSI
jgi:hypothetical protein